MATCVSCSPNPLVSLSSAATFPAFTSSPRCLPIISCSSKRKKKASAKSKTLPPAKPTKLNPPPNEDFLLGIAGGASTLTALQPLLDEEDTLPQQKQKLELQLAHIQKPPLSPTAQQNVDPLLRFTLATYKPSNSDSVLQVCDAQVALVDDIIDDHDDDEEASIHDAPRMLDVAARELEEEEEDDDDFEWVEINVEDDDENDEDEEERYVYWEGDLPPMTKEEEAKVLRRAKKDLARLEKEKRASAKGAASYANLIEEVEDEEADEEEEDDEEAEDEDDTVEDYSSDGSETDEEADAALAQFEASARKTTVAKNSQTAVFMKDETSHSATKKKLPMGHMQSEIEMEDVLDEEEDETAFAACITKEAKAEDRRKSQLQSEEGERKQPKRSIPAVMRSFDKAKIFVKAGNGGNGVVAFRREKFVPFGGPSGGSGGRGGNIYVKADPSMNSLLSFRRSVHFRAGRGSHGMGKSQDGATGEDCTIDVPLGTVIREAGDGLSAPGKVLLEVTRPNQCELLLLGGRGGRGNTAFKTGRNKTPQLAENGEEGTEMWLELELKLVADVGIIGVPNAGKSTLLSVISAAQPAIAAYPFTTLLPNLGVVPIGFDSTMVVADLPGLLEGAHLGIGLGHEFLRHTERCRVLVHIVDGTSQQPEQEYEAVRLELQLFNPALSEKPYIVAFNKMDIPEAADRWPNFQAYLKQKGIEPICMSAATKTGVIDVVNKAYSLLQSLPSSPYENDSDEGADEMTIGEIIRRQRSAPLEEFEIIQDKGSKIWQVQGVGLERFVQMTNWEYFEALTRFQHVLTVSGVNKALKEQGVAEGDTVIVGEMELVWHDSEDIRAADWKRGFRGSRLWPH